MYMKETLITSLKELSNLTPEELIENRYVKFKNIGEFKE